jgi:hypothetical protein
MDDREHQRSMSLIPYAPAESREIVLYVSAVVVILE